MEQWILRNRPRGNPKNFSLRFPSSGLFSTSGLPEYLEFESHPLDQEENDALKPFFIVQRSDIDKAGFLDIRLMVHSLILRLLNEGWIDLRYPKSFLAKDLQRLKDCDSNRFFTEPGTVSAFLKYGHPHLSTEGRSIVEHFLDWGNETDGRRTLRQAWESPSSLHAAIQLLLGTRKDITRSNIVRHLGISGGRRHSGPKFINPGLYYSIIKNFFNKYQTIFDACPGYGSKLLAASMLGSEYISQCGHKDMAAFVGCKLGNRDRYDLAILSDNEPLHIDDAIKLLDKYLRRSAGVLVLVNNIDNIPERLKPRRILKAQMCPNFVLQHVGYSYFLIY